MTRKPIQPQDKYVLRLPDGLRDRIKAYADRQGTSMNYEIVRVLERHFPEQWPIDMRLRQLAQMMLVLKAGVADPRIEQFIDDFKMTVEGIVSGRVTGVDLETRESIEDMWRSYRMNEGEEEQDSFQNSFDEEETRSLELIERPEKYAVPRPERKSISDMTYDELEAYRKKLESRMPEPREALRIDFDDKDPFPPKG